MVNNELSALERIEKRGSQYGVVESVQKKYQEGHAVDHRLISPYLAYANNSDNRELTNEEASLMFQTYKDDAQLFEKDLKESYEKSREDLVSVASDGLEDLVGTFEGDELKVLTFTTPSDRVHYKLAKALDQEDYNAAIEAYKERVDEIPEGEDNEVYRRFMTNRLNGPEAEQFVKKFGGLLVAGERSRLIQELSNEDGLDEDRARSYVVESLNGLDDEEKEQHLIGLAMRYVTSQAQQAA